MRKLFLAALFTLGLVSQALAVQPVRSASSGNVANAAAVATFPAQAQNFNYLTGFEVAAGGATAGACVNVTVTGVLGGTLTYPFCVPTGATVGAAPLIVEFAPPLPTPFNTAITVTVPALGAGNTNAAVNIHGYVE